VKGHVRSNSHNLERAKQRAVSEIYAEAYRSRLTGFSSPCNKVIWCYSYVKQRCKALEPAFACHAGLPAEWMFQDMNPDWNDSQPIYRQLRDRIVGMILDGLLHEGDPLPSVRTVAAEGRVNPLTVLKAYQQLADDQLVEKRRGLGMFVLTGARAALLAVERERFLGDEWPRVAATIRRLGLTPDELFKAQDGSPRLAQKDKEN
jgi:GntR family transcriptional regulator